MKRRKHCLEYTFRVSWDNAVIPGVSRVSALKRSSEVLDYRDGADPGATHKAPGRVKFEPITLERGVTHDTSFQAWADQLTGAATSSLRKTVRIELFDLKRKLVLVYELYRCWPSAYAAFEQLVDDGRSCLMEALTLEHEGWDREAPLKQVPVVRRPGR